MVSDWHTYIVSVYPAADTLVFPHETYMCSLSKAMRNGPMGTVCFDILEKVDAPHRFKVARGGEAGAGRGGGWSLREGFCAYTHEQEGTTRFHILRAGEPSRYKVSRGGDGEGWRAVDSGAFFAFADEQEGTLRFNILDARNPHRFKISREGAGAGWTLRDHFWAY